MAKTKKADVQAAAENQAAQAAAIRPGYGVSLLTLNEWNAEKNTDAIKEAGGAQRLAAKLQANLTAGLDPARTGGGSVDEHREVFGANELPPVPPVSIFYLIWVALHDPIIILLCVAALVSTVLGSAIPSEREENGWIEGVAIWVAVIIVVAVGAGNDYQKDKQFRKLNAAKDIFDVKVIRGGQRVLVPSTQLVVGDILLLDTGDRIVADGYVTDSQGLVIDEASLTGEADPIKKNPQDDAWVRSGTQVSDGSGAMLVLAVGPNSEWGKLMAHIAGAEDSATPLQEHLEYVAAGVGKVGFVVAVACFIVLLIEWCVENKGFPIKKINDNGPVQFFLYAITIVVVAVPEGLPLAVTISLAYSMKKMMKDNNFVRVLAACETMGGATAICSDKTGTLTENRMTVVEGWFAGTSMPRVPNTEEISPAVLHELKLNCALNSKAFLVDNDGKVGMVGNRTECALLLLLRTWNIDYTSVREEYKEQLQRIYGFSSARKMASALVRLPTTYRLYNKGAAEWVLRECVAMVDAAGAVKPMSEGEKQNLHGVVTEMASRGLRCLALAYTDIPLEDKTRPADFFEEGDHLATDLVLLCIVGIKDPVRKEVPDAIATCHRAGIVVRMVTGDNVHTAKHIARECGILTNHGQKVGAHALDPANNGHLPDHHHAHQTNENHSKEGIERVVVKPVAARLGADGKPIDQAFEIIDPKGGKGSNGVATTNGHSGFKDPDGFEPIAMEGPVFRAMSEEEMMEMLPRLRVLARSSPEDKLVLVRTLKKMGEVVAVTGDGTNDAPALKESDVGLAMGIAGTEVAKEAADIVILDDNFSSIVKSVLWGRSVFSNIRKFLQFQLTVNLVALVTAFIGAIVGGHQPLNVLQLLWVNLIMDTMGALALATEYPNQALLLEKPHGRTEALITKKMWKHIFVQGAYQFFWLCICLYGIPLWINRYKPQTKDDYLTESCADELGTRYTAANYPGATFGTAEICNIARFCGYPNKATGDRNSPACPLYTGTPLTGDLTRDVCGSTTACGNSRLMNDARNRLNDQFEKSDEEEYAKPLSLLFQVFIMCQVANEINARRINDEYNVFAGFFNNYIFVSVICITMGLQAIIINFLGLFFKTVPLDWKEWLGSIAIGLGAFPVALLTKFISRCFPRFCC